MNALMKPNFTGINRIKSIFDNDFFDTKQRLSYPKVNISSLDNEYIIEAHVPGLSKEDISVELKNDILSIKGNYQNSSENSEENYIRKEFYQSSFSRNFRLIDVDTENINCNLNNGVLTIKVKKVVCENEVKKITVK